MRHIYSALILITICSKLFAQHTFSICAVDPLTGEVGSAGASCIPGSIIISDVHPGIGVVHTQSYYLIQNQEYAMELMNDGISPQAILDSVTANDYQGDSSVRQYGAVDLVDGGRSAGFTGFSCLEWRGHITGPTYAIQGNILLGPEILEGMEQGFLNTEGNLACKLMGAMQGANIPGADTRCLEWGISAESAFIRVGKATDKADELWLDIEVKDINGIINALNPGLDPIDSLQSAFDAIGGCNYTGVGIKDDGYYDPVIYPQPTFDIVIFSLDGNFAFIQIHDMNGVLLLNEEIFNEKNVVVDSQMWSTGIYLYSLERENGEKICGKLIIE